MAKNQIVEAIIKRRSIRSYTAEPVSEESLELLLEAGRWAPSGLNNQPWRFAVIRSRELIDSLAELTHSRPILKSAQACIALFIDQNVSYDRIKDAQGVGACIQNMLLAAHSIDLGAVWLGEILKNKDKVRDILNLSGQMDLQAVIALGHPTPRERKSARKVLEELIVGRY